MFQIFHILQNITLILAKEAAASVYVYTTRGIKVTSATQNFLCFFSKEINLPFKGVSCFP